MLLKMRNMFDKVLFILLFTIMICMSTAIGVTIHDKDKNDLQALQEYIAIEASALGVNKDAVDKLLEDNITVSSLIRSYEKFRVAWELDYLYKDTEYEDCVQLYEYNVDNTSTFIYNYISCLKKYDMMYTLNETDDNYWKSMTEILLELRQYERTLYNSNDAKLYMNTALIQGWCIMIVAVVLVSSFVFLVLYYILLLFSKKNFKSRK